MSPTTFSKAAVKAFDLVLDELEEFGFLRVNNLSARREARRSFEEKIAAQADAFRACVSADELEQQLARSRAERGLEDFVRSFKDSHDFAQARAAFFATFDPPPPRRIT